MSEVKGIDNAKEHRRVEQKNDDAAKVAQRKQSVAQTDEKKRARKASVPKHVGKKVDIQA